MTGEATTRAIAAATMRMLVPATVVGSALVAVVGTRLAADRTLLVLDIAIVLLAVVSAVYPDRHVGLAVLVLVGISWWVTVDDVATPWSIAVAGAVTLFHASNAASSVAPPSAAWSRAMILRWSRRSLMMIVASACTWVAVIIIRQTDVAANTLLVVAALIMIATAAVAVVGSRALVGDRTGTPR